MSVLIKNLGALVVGTLLGSSIVWSYAPSAEAGPPVPRTSVVVRVVKAPDGQTCYIAVGPRGNARAMSCK
jgi:hypothetical protein